METVQKIAVPLVAVALFLLAWEALVWVNSWPNYKMASPSDLPPAFWKFRWLFLEMGWQTLWRTVLGLCLAVVFGTLIGMVMGFSRIARDGLYPLLVGFNAIPKATLVPVIALIFIGQHDFNTVLMAFLISFFPIAVSVGSRSVWSGFPRPWQSLFPVTLRKPDATEERAKLTTALD
jgi:NitT/TauT family transport system permease protein